MNEKEFLEKKAEYLEILNERLDIISNLVNSGNPSGLKVSQVLLNPKNEVELEYAKMYFKLREIVCYIINMISLGELTCQSPEESKAFNFVYDYIKASLNNANESEIKTILEKYHLNEFENCATMFLELPLAFSNNEAKDILFEKLGMTGEIDKRFIILINSYLAKAQKDISLDNFLKLDTEDDIKKSIEYGNKYFQICNDFIDKYFIKHNKLHIIL